MALETFRISYHDAEPNEVRGHIIGFFGIDLREPGKWCLTHIRTGNNLSRMAARSLSDAKAAVAILNTRPDIWDNGEFGRAYPPKSRVLWIQKMREFAKSDAGKEVIRLCPETIGSAPDEDVS